MSIWKEFEDGKIVKIYCMKNKKKKRNGSVNAIRKQPYKIPCWTSLGMLTR